MARPDCNADALLADHGEKTMIPLEYSYFNMLR